MSVYRKSDGRPWSKLPAEENGGTSAESFDKKKLLSNFNGMEDVLEILIEDFIRLNPELLKRIQDAILRKDRAELEFAAHTLKGVLSNFFSLNAFEISSELERVGKSGEFEKASILIHRLVHEIDRLCVELWSLLRSSRAA